MLTTREQKDSLRSPPFGSSRQGCLDKGCPASIQPATQPNATCVNTTFRVIEVISKELPEFLGLCSLGMFLLFRVRATHPSPSMTPFSSGSKHSEGGEQSGSQCFSLIAYFFVFVFVRVSVVCVAMNSPDTILQHRKKLAKDNFLSLIFSK